MELVILIPLMLVLFVASMLLWTMHRYIINPKSSKQVKPEQSLISEIEEFLRKTNP
jgi:hypothetical protein